MERDEMQQMRDDTKEMLLSGMSIEDNRLNFYVINPEDTTKGLKISLDSVGIKNETILKDGDVEEFLKSGCGTSVENVINVISDDLAKAYIEGSELRETWYQVDPCAISDVAGVNRENKGIYDRMSAHELGNSEIIEKLLLKKHEYNIQEISVKGNSFEDLKFYDAKNNQVLRGGNEIKNATILSEIVIGSSEKVLYGSSRIIFDEKQIDVLLHPKGNALKGCWDIDVNLSILDKKSWRNEKRFYLSSNKRPFSFSEIVKEMRQIDDKGKIRVPSFEEMKNKILEAQKKNQKTNDGVADGR